jgi:hypothetical protein
MLSSVYDFATIYPEVSKTIRNNTLTTGAEPVVNSAMTLELLFQESLHG